MQAVFLCEISGLRQGTADDVRKNGAGTMEIERDYQSE